MNKLRKIFKHDSSSDKKYTGNHSNSSPSATSQSTYHRAGASDTAGVATSGKPADGVLLTTNYGDITIVLFSDKTPRTCENFAGLADSGKYNNVIFHRIIPDFMIQGGDPTGTGRGGSSIFGGKFEDEFHPSLKHTGKGILSMANSGPGTNGSQFFICLAPTPHLNGRHTVFGQVVDGMDVVDMIGNVRTDSGDKPLEAIKIIRAKSFSA